MFVRCHLPMELDTGPGTRKSSTLCSLVLLLLVIATFLVCEVPGQMEEIVGLGNHKKTGNQVELNPYTVNVKEKNFNLKEYKYRFEDACDVKIEKDYIELQYNEDGKGCIVDLLSRGRKNKIKLTAVVRNKRGGIKKCLAEGVHLDNSYNNNMPFVYSVSNKDIEKLNKGLNNDGSGKTCKKMPWTSLEVSWSRSKSGTHAYAHTHLIGEEKHGLSPKKGLEDSEMTFDLEITAPNKFTMNFSGKQEFDTKGGVCQIVKPEVWTITNTDLRDKHLFVFSLLSRNATFVFDGERITDENPSEPYCELFIRFNRPDYELLYVNPQPPLTPTTTTTKVTSTETTETSTCAPCPTSTVLMTTTTAAKNISSPAVKCPAEGKCPEKSNVWIYVILIAVGVIIIGILAWFTWNWVEVNSEKRAARAAKRAEDRGWYADYQAEAKVKGSENMRPFAIWKDDKKEEYNKRFMDRHPIDKLSAAMWRKAEKEKDDKSKMQFIVDQIVRFKDQELYDNEYWPELTEKGYETVGEFEEWKKKKYINTFAVVETEIEYEPPKHDEKELLPGASIEEKKRARR